MEKKEINRILEEHRQLAAEFFNLVTKGKCKYTLPELKQKLIAANKEVVKVRAYLKDEEKEKKKISRKERGSDGKAQRVI